MKILENMTTKKKILLAVLSLVTALIVVAVVTIRIVWSDEIKTMSTITLLSEENNDEFIEAGPMYEMTVEGNYGYDKFIEMGGVKNDEELTNFIISLITKGLFSIDADVNTPNAGCSAFTAVTPDGDRIVARNFDYPRTTAMIVKTAPDDGRYASVSTVDIQPLTLGLKIDPETNEVISGGTYIKDELLDKLAATAAVWLPSDGMNEKGLSISVLMSFQAGEELDSVPTINDTEKPNLTTPTLIRLVLDNCATVDEAIELVERYDYNDSANDSFHFIIADETGKSAIIEWVKVENANEATDTDGEDRILKVTYNDDDSHINTAYLESELIGLQAGHEGKNDFQYITNFVIEPGYYNDSPLWKVFGLDRYNIIASSINPDGTNPSGIVEESEAMEILSSVGFRKLTKLEDPNKIPTSKTIWSVVYNLTDRSAKWVSNEHYEDPDMIFTYDLNERD